MRLIALTFNLIKSLQYVVGLLVLKLTLTSSSSLKTHIMCLMIWALSQISEI